MISHFNYTLKMNDSYINSNYDRLPGSYLFSTIAHKIKEYQGAHANADIIRLGIGDVTTPLIPEVIKAMHSAVNEMGVKDTFRGYGPEQGYDFLREAIVRGEYTSRGIEMDPNDIFVSDGSKCDVANIQELFSGEARIAIPDPVYPVYLDSNVMAGRTGTLQDDGSLRRIVELDVYAAVQFNRALYDGWDEMHRLAEPGYPNYGEEGCEYVPGARLKWTPLDDISLGVRAEYDSDRNRIAYGSLVWNHKVSKDFKYNVAYAMRDHRYWDFSSVPFVPSQMLEDTQNLTRMSIVDVSFEYQVCDWLAVGPHIRWDLRDGDLDTVGFWVDYLTDCLGFRLMCEYDNDFRTVYGYYMDDDFSVGFYIYLRAFGPSGIFSSR